jgi:Tfp pilus assembly protein PilF
VKKAKALFEDALAIDEKAMNAGAHTSLGSLYYKVPGWPVAFGSNEEAEKHLKAALSISPNDIDANYFYADYLIYRKQYAAAIPVLEKAMSAPMRPGREIADAGRRGEIQADLTAAQEKMKSASAESR